MITSTQGPELFIFLFAQVLKWGDFEGNFISFKMGCLRITSTIWKIEIIVTTIVTSKLYDWETTV